MRYRPGLGLVLKGVTLDIKVRSGRFNFGVWGFGVRAALVYLTLTITTKLDTLLYFLVPDREGDARIK